MQPITVYYFGDLMEQVAIGRETLRLPPNVKTIALLMRLLSSRGGDWQKAFGQQRSTLRVTVNKQDAGPETPLNGGEEVAFIESVSL